MVGKYKVKNHLTLDERRKIKEGIDADLSYLKIAESIGRAKSTIIREAKRLGGPGDYEPQLAHLDFKKKQMLSGVRRGSSLYQKILEMEVEDDED